MRFPGIFKKRIRDAPKSDRKEQDELQIISFDSRTANLYSVGGRSCSSAVRGKPYNNPFGTSLFTSYNRLEPILKIPAVNSAVDTISNTIASTPVKLYKYKAGDVVEVKNDPRVNFLNQDTGKYLNGYQLKKAMVRDYLLNGGGYAYIVKRSEDYDGLMYVPCYNIQKEEIRSRNGTKKSRIRIGTNVYQSYEFVRLLRNTTDGIVGHSIKDELSSALDNIWAQSDLINSVGQTKYLIKHTPNVMQDRIEQAKKNILAMLAEDKTSVGAAIDVELQRVEDTNTDIPIIELSKTAEESINNIFHIKSDFDSTFREAIYPIIKAFEAALNENLLLERQKNKMFFSFDTREIMRPSPKERYEAYKIALESGFMTVNEVRQAENLNRLEGMDTLNVGLKAVLYDVNSGKYIIPNTSSVIDLNNTNVDSEHEEEGSDDNDSARR